MKNLAVVMLIRGFEIDLSEDGLASTNPADRKKAAVGTDYIDVQEDRVVFSAPWMAARNTSSFA